MININIRTVSKIWVGYNILGESSSKSKQPAAGIFYLFRNIVLTVHHIQGGYPVTHGGKVHLKKKEESSWEGLLSTLIGVELRQATAILPLGIKWFTPSVTEGMEIVSYPESTSGAFLGCRNAGAMWAFNNIMSGGVSLRIKIPPTKSPCQGCWHDYMLNKSSLMTDLHCTNEEPWVANISLKQ